MSPLSLGNHHRKLAKSSLPLIGFVSYPKHLHCRPMAFITPQPPSTSVTTLRTSINFYHPTKITPAPPNIASRKRPQSSTSPGLLIHHMLSSSGLLSTIRVFSRHHLLHLNSDNLQSGPRRVHPTSGFQKEDISIEEGKA